jgi:hypothetical protein
MTRGHDLSDSNVQTATIGLLITLVIFVVFAINSFKWEKK